jgi:hypothetical protein
VHDSVEIVFANSDEEWSRCTVRHPATGTRPARLSLGGVVTRQQALREAEHRWRMMQWEREQ